MHLDRSASDMSISPSSVARAMAAWCGEDEVDGAQIVRFYKQHEQYKEVVQAAKGLKTFVVMHNKLLSSRMEGTVLFISKAQIDFMETLSEMLDTIRVSAKNDRMAAIESVLEPLKEGDSMRKFALKMKEAGVCLKDGKVYGSALPKKLNQRINNRYPLRVNKNDAKQFPLVKRCLVMCH